jgi:DNA-binding response OmpR family regulator
MKIVYVLDDSEDQHMLISKVLKKLDCIVKCFTRVEDFIAQVKQSPPDLCLIDNDLGNSNKKEGALISQTIKKSKKYNCKVAIISAYRSLDFMKECYDQSIDDYFTKPLDLTLFVEKASNLLGLSASIRQLPIRKASLGTSLYYSHELILSKITEDDIQLFSSSFILPGTELKILENSIFASLYESYKMVFRVKSCAKSKAGPYPFLLCIESFVDHTREVDFSRDMRKLIMELKYKYELNKQAA